MSYRSELIQVAAVALATVQNLDTGSTERDTIEAVDAEMEIVDAVLRERASQERQWGTRNTLPDRWLTILTEEVGEVARAILERDGI